ncbi:MAG TPA: HEPN domain-containing protein [Rickettsiales bacterium]|nr:HEPN domain-containing protein [Rickettsiales bacterium]
MKKSLKHLPESKQNELQKIVSAIQKTCKDVEKIILFGSYARGDYKEAKDLKEDRRTGHISDYDILVVTGKKKSTDKFSSWNKTEKLKLTAPVRAIAHDIESLNINLAEGQYFFTDIKKEGVTLFDSRKYKLANKRKLKPKEKQRIARDHFDEWFRSAVDFLAAFELMMSRDRHKNAAFQLHQVAESCYKAILLVCTNYNPKEHFLWLLGQKTAKYHPDLKTLFPKKNQKDKDRFKLLDDAYIGGRYDPDFRISKRDLEILAKDVKKLLELTEKICEQKIQSLIEKK